MKLTTACKQELEQAEGRVQVLVEDKGGKMQPAEMELQPTGTGAIEVDEPDDQE
jgi:hypothetical protein